MVKVITKGPESVLALANGIRDLAEIVGSTVGPKGKNVITRDKRLQPLATNDGVTIAKDVHFTDETMELGADLVRQAAEKTNVIGGDGTTTTTILASSLIDSILFNSDEVDVLKTKGYLQDLQKSAFRTIDSMTRKVNSNKRIYDVATISAQDKEVGKHIASIFEKLGDNTEIVVEEGYDDSGITSYATKGMRFDKGYIHPNFINDSEKGEVLLTNVTTMAIKGKVQHFNDIIEFVKELSGKAEKSLVIFAEDFSQDFINTCWTNHLNGIFTIIPIRMPYGPEFVEKLDKLIDCGVNMLPLLDVKHSMLQKLQISRTHTSLIHDSGAEEAPGIGVIKVALATDVSTTEKTLRVEDAINATKCAIKGGVVAGGGITLLRCGIEPLDMPFKMILANAGYDKDEVLEHCIKVRADKNPNHGYDVSQDELVLINMTKNGIIDPAIVVKECVRNACAIAEIVISTSATIVNKKTTITN